MVQSLWWAIPAAGVLASAVALVVARRGRRVDDHPHCRRCGFDLFGTPAGATACSECGADLARPRAVRVGRRQARRGLARAAGAVLLLSAGWLGVVGWAARGTNWQRHKPVWVLMRETASPAPAIRDAALAELRRRLGAGALADGQVVDLADRALAYQADTGRPWVPAWGAVLEDARDAGKLSDDRWRRYAKQAFVLRLRVRPFVRKGDPLPVRLEPVPERIGPRAWLVGEFRYGRTYQIGGRPAVYIYDQYRPYMRTLPGGYGWHGDERPDAFDGMSAVDREGLAPGPQTIVVPVGVRVFQGPHERPAADDPSAVSLADDDVVLRADWMLLPADAPPTVSLASDPSLRPAVEAALKSESPTIDPDSGWGIYVAEPPVSLGYDVVVRSRGAEARVGQIECPAGVSCGFVMVPLGRHPGLPLGDAADIVLRPSPAAAATAVDIRQIWGGEVVFEDVPIRKDLTTPARNFEPTPGRDPAPTTAPAAGAAGASAATAATVGGKP